MSAPLKPHDLFISHASADNEHYILPLARALDAHGVSYWLDDKDISYGDIVISSLSEGLRQSQYVLLCLSSNFLKSHWAKHEMSAALSAQNDSGEKKVLPLFLNSKDEILNEFPILRGQVYLEFDSGPEAVARELAKFIKGHKVSPQLLRLSIESVDTGQFYNLDLPRRGSLRLLLKKAQEALRVKEEADIGSALPFRVRWVLVDKNAEDEWKRLAAWKKLKVNAIVKTKDGLQISRVDQEHNLEELGLYDGMVFHLYAIDNNPPRGGGGGGGGGPYGKAGGG